MLYNASKAQKSLSDGLRDVIIGTILREMKAHARDWVFPSVPKGKKHYKNPLENAPKS